MKHLKYAAILAAALAFPTGAALAQYYGPPWGGGGPYYGPGMMGPYGYGPGPYA